MLEKYPKEVKLVFKNLFNQQSHAFSRKAAEGALAASRQGKFADFHGKLFVNQKSLNDQKIREIAQEVGLNLDQFERDMKDSRVAFLIDRDIRQAQQAGVRATPTVFVNGKFLRDISIQGFQQAIEAELRKRK